MSTEELIDSLTRLNQGLKFDLQPFGWECNKPNEIRRFLPLFKQIFAAFAKAAIVVGEFVPPPPKLPYGTWAIDYINAKDEREQKKAFLRGYYLQPEVISYRKSKKLEGWQLLAAYRAWKRPFWLEVMEAIFGCSNRSSWDHFGNRCGTVCSQINH